MSSLCLTGQPTKRLNGEPNESKAGRSFAAAEDDFRFAANSNHLSALAESSGRHARAESGSGQSAIGS